MYFAPPTKQIKNWIFAHFLQFLPKLQYLANFQVILVSFIGGCDDWGEGGGGGDGGCGGGGDVVIVVCGGRVLVVQ